MDKLWEIANNLYKFHRGGNVARLFEMMSFVFGSHAVSAKAQIGRGTVFYHHALGCTVHGKVVIGCDGHIFPNVTIGSKWPNGVCEGEAPQIGDRVFIGAGAVLLGNIKIGNDVIIGSNAVVTSDVPSNSIAVGIPAQVKSRLLNRGQEIAVTRVLLGYFGRIEK